MTPLEDNPVPLPPFRWTTRVLLPLGVLAGFLALFAGSLAGSLTPVIEVEALPVVERPALVQIAGSGHSSRAATVQAAGWLEPDPFVTHASALVDGSVREVLFREGQAVSAGDVLVRLVDDDAILALKRAEAELAAAEEVWSANIAARTDAAITAAAVTETSASVALALAELEVERALGREAERVRKRRQSLVATGAVSQEDFDAAKASAEAQAARVRVAEERVIERKSQLDRVRAELDAAEQRLVLRTEDRQRLELARVAREEARLNLERTVIRAPISGLIMRRLVEPGSTIMAFSDTGEMARVAALYDPAKMQVRVDVPLADAGQISVGQPVEATVEIFPDRVFTGRVTRITNFADIQKNTLEVKIALDAPAAELKPEMLARVRFLDITAEAAKTGGSLAIFAPAPAVSGDFVWVVSRFDGDKGVAVKRSVSTVGQVVDGWKQVSSGLNPGDLLIISPTESLQPNQAVRVRRGGGNDGLH